MLLEEAGASGFPWDYGAAGASVGASSGAGGLEGTGFRGAGDLEFIGCAGVQSQASVQEGPSYFRTQSVRERLSRIRAAGG